jgi:hypothetical protein
LPATIEVTVGADGAPSGVTSTEFDIAPSANVLTARIEMEYVCPFFSPLIVMGLVPEGDDGAIQVVPPSIEYSKFVIVESPS